MSAELAKRTVDVRAVRLQAPDEAVARYECILAPEERQRAARFAFPHLQRGFVLARGALRVLLARLLETAPDRIRFVYGVKGKPTLAAPGRVRFNMSHSGGLAVFAFTLDCELGVDVEEIRPLDDLAQIAARFFCAGETAELMSLPVEERTAAFFRCWTRKEAYIKAIGDGLSAPLDGFAVTLRRGEAARLVHLAGDPAAARAWALHALDLSPGYEGALAYRDAERAVRVLPAVDAGQLLER
jgi:4'-phosphopantetheinyl transferase